MLLSHFNGRRSIRSRWCTDKLFTGSPATRLAAPTLDKPASRVVRQRKESVLWSLQCRNLRNNYPRPPPAKVSMNFRRADLGLPGIVFILWAAPRVSAGSAWYWLRSWCSLWVRPAVSLFSHCCRRESWEFFPAVCGEWAACVSLCLLTMQTRPMQFWKSVLRSLARALTHTRSWLTESRLILLDKSVVLGNFAAAAFCSITPRLDKK